MGVHTDGGMCERLTVPAIKIHHSDVLTFDELALVETLSVGLHAVSRASPEPGDAILVIGAGPIGLSVATHAIRTASDVTIADVDEERLSRALTLLTSARVLLIPGGERTDLRRVLDSRPTIVFDATGSRQSMQAAIQVVAPGGCVVFVGLTKGRICFDDPGFHARELRLLGSRNANAVDFKKTIELLEQRLISTSGWVTDQSTYTEFVDKFNAWVGGAPPKLKAMLVL